MEIRGSTVVITGASSGNGKALALTLAKEGANLVLAARREELLQELARECGAMGVKALAIKTDVTNENEMLNLYIKGLSLTGQIDAWINNAGVLAMGEFTATPWDVSKQIVQTNLIGSMHAAYLVTPHFRNNKRGILVHMNSLSAYIPTPHVTAYSASKLGLRGFSEALRYELSSFKDIHVCDVFATFLDSTGMDHAANFTGVKLAPPPPVIDPCDVAEAIVKLLKHPKPNIRLGANAYLGILARKIAPETLGKVMDKLTRLYYKKGPKESLTEGNIKHPVSRGRGVHGGWRGLGIFGRMKRESQDNLEIQ